MIIRLCVIVILASVCSAVDSNHDWDIAVAVGNQVELLKNGDLQGVTTQTFQHIKSLTFDEVRHQLIISDTNDKGETTIYSILLADHSTAVPVVPNVNDNVEDIVIDPITDIIYWTDSIGKRILTMPLNESNPKIQVLFQFDNELPTGLAIDSCRRKLYWTNTNRDMPTIERSNLDGSKRETIIFSNLNLPHDITIDQTTNKIFWVDITSSIYYKIESANLDGTGRKIVINERHQTPYGIAVTKDKIFWTDLNDRALWRLDKNTTGAEPEKIRNFNEDPKGIYAKVDLNDVDHCEGVVHTLSAKKNIVDQFEVAHDSPQCLNYGELIAGNCRCVRGFSGTRCEIDLCHNFCVHGECHISTEGYPTCKCSTGFSGPRCESDVCKVFCLNDGICQTRLNNKDIIASCQCKEGFSGERCEKDDVDPFCTAICQNEEQFAAIDGKKCRCANNAEFYAVTKKNTTTSEALSSANISNDLTDKLKDPVVLVSWLFMFLMLWVIVGLSVFVCRLKYRRPRIKKRIIVNKNVTPLTYRPGQSTEQCEITIENCCNMNICETPCFEPPQFQCKKSDEKKTLLTSMENGGEIY